MSKTKMIAGLAATAAGALLTMPVYASNLQSLGDNALEKITGKANTATFSGTNSTTIHADNTNGGVSVGYYQWDDDHSADASDHKGANDQSGASSNVQGSVSGEINTLLWGAGAQVTTTNTNLTAGSIDSESWGTMYLGGF